MMSMAHGHGPSLMRRPLAHMTMHVGAHTHTHKCTQHTHTVTVTHTHTHTHTHTCTQQTHTHTPSHIYTHTRARARNTHTHARTHTHRHTHTHTNTLTHTHTHTHTQRTAHTDGWDSWPPPPSPAVQGPDDEHGTRRRRARCGSGRASRAPLQHPPLEGGPRLQGMVTVRTHRRC